MNVDVDGLRAAAEAATAGPWECWGDGWFGSVQHGDVATKSDVSDKDAAYIAAASPDVVLALLDRLATLEGQLERTEQQIHEPGGFIDEVVDLTERLSAAKTAISDVRGDPLLGRVAGRLDVALREALAGPQEATGADLRASEPQDDHPCYSDALRWAADVAHSEARWQWERDLRRITGAQIVAQRAEVLEACYREAADRHDKQASGAESDHGDRREGEGLV